MSKLLAALSSGTLTLSEVRGQLAGIKRGIATAQGHISVLIDGCGWAELDAMFAEMTNGRSELETALRAFADASEELGAYHALLGTDSRDCADAAAGSPDQIVARDVTVAPPRPYGVPAEWVRRRSRDQKGWIWQRPGSVNSRDVVRVMGPAVKRFHGHEHRYPHGYVRFHDSEGNLLGPDGRPSQDSHVTHFKRDAKGGYSIPERWSHV